MSGRASRLRQGLGATLPRLGSELPVVRSKAIRAARGGRYGIVLGMEPRVGDGRNAIDGAEDVRSRFGEDLARLADWDQETSDEHWRRVLDFVELHGSVVVRLAASRWLASGDPVATAVGLDVLGEIGVNDAEARSMLVEAAARVADSGDEDVRWSLAVALGANSTDGRATPWLLRLAGDEANDVRFQAVSGLSVPADDEPEEGGAVVELLLRAMDDEVPNIRDWATFALGVTRDVDSQAVREALHRRLADSEADTAGEAAVALGKRGDQRVLHPLLEALGSDDAGNLWVEAAAELADPRLLPVLQGLKKRGWQDGESRPHLLDEAIARCSEGRR